MPSSLRLDVSSSFSYYREASAAGGPSPVPDSVTVKVVEIPRVPVPGLEEDASGTVKAEWIEPKETKTGQDIPVMVFVHGGGYCICSPETHRGVAGGIAANGIRVLSVDYRMAPEVPYPGYLVDSLSAYKHVLSLGIPASRVVICGDSAGGNLTLVTAMYLRDNPSFAPQVAGIAPISPWTDMTGSSPTIYLGGEYNSCVIGQGREWLEGMTGAISGGNTSILTQPLLSPLYDDPSKALPPTLASLATVDRLLGEDLAYYIPRLEKAQNIAIDYYEDQFHVFQLIPSLAQSQTCFKRIAEFSKAVTSGGKFEGGITAVDYDGSHHKLEGGVETLRKLLKGLMERVSKEPGDKGGKARDKYHAVVGGK